MQSRQDRGFIPFIPLVILSSLFKDVRTILILSCFLCTHSLRVYHRLKRLTTSLGLGFDYGRRLTVSLVFTPSIGFLFFFT